MYAKSTRLSAKREVQKERSATIKSRALGALKLASEGSCARSARWECAREAGRFFKVYECRISFVQTSVFYSVNYQKRVDTGWTLYIYCQKITFSTIGIRLGQLFPSIVASLVINGRSPTSDQHLADRHSRQSVVISAWETFPPSSIVFFKFLER